MGISLILIATTTLALRAQAPAAVSDRVRKAMLEQEPGWQLQDSAVEDGRFWHEWTKGSQRLSIDYTEHPTDDDASAWLRSLPGKLPMSGEEAVTGIGEEAMMWGRVTTTGVRTIRFRKARYIGAVTAPSKDLATRIAKLLAAQIDEHEPPRRKPPSG